MQLELQSHEAVKLILSPDSCGLFRSFRFPTKMRFSSSRKKKLVPSPTGECAGIVLSWRGRCQVDIVPAKLTSIKMHDHFCQRLDALCVRDFVKQTLHHRDIAVRGKDAGLDEALFAYHLKMQFESQAVGQLTHELPLCSAISLSKRMDSIYLGKQTGNPASKFSPWQAFEKTLVSQLVEYVFQFPFDQIGRREPDDSSASNILSFG